jgi:Antitoxin-like ribbon-helix-helix
MSKPVLGDVALQQLRRAGNPVTPAVEAPATTRKYLPPGRVTRVAITGFFEKPVKKQLRTIGLEHDKTLQDLLREAINDLFAKYNRPEIAE